MSVTVLTGDARDLVAGIAADVIITDPVWPNCPAGLLQGYEAPEALLRDVLQRAAASVRRVVIVLRSDCDPRFLLAVPPRWRFFNSHWLAYAMPGYLGRKLGGNEIAYAFGEPIPRRDGQRVIPSRAPVAQPRDRLPNGHPCSRALVHFDWLVRWWSESGETVLDPFCGSGTTLLAAARQGRAAVGIEIDPGYAELARARCDALDPLLRERAS